MRSLLCVGYYIIRVYKPCEVETPWSKNYNKILFLLFVGALSLSPLCELFFPPLCELFLPQRPAVDFTLTTMDSDFTEKLQQIKLTEEEVDLLMVQATQREKNSGRMLP